MKSNNIRRAAVMLCAALMAGMAFTGCEKENNGGTIRLNAEKLSGDGKTYVDGVNMGWVNGDLIKFNATTCTVSNGAATGIPTDVDLIAFYPNDISEATAPASSVSVTVPSEYTYSYSDGHQILALPMVGKASSGDEYITMKHLCSAMQITINNGFTEGLVLDSIILRGSGLSGTTVVSNLSNSGTPTVDEGSVDSVRMAFSGTTIAANGGTLTVQIPVLPVEQGTATRVSVRGHLATSQTAYRYSRSTSIALLRATVHAAPVTMSTTDNHTEVVASIPEGALPGVFTVSPNKQVRFSKGNLRATTSDNGANWIWSFAEHQYDYIGNAAANNAINGNGTVSANGTVDLFGWSTGSTYYGINNSTNNSTYTGNFKDWRLVFGDSSPWRTLTSDEWVYLLNTRTTTSGVLYAKANVNGVYGLIILPDDWNTTYHTLNNTNTSGADYTTNTIDLSTWTNSLEAHGAVFLPAAGYRSGKNFYNAGSRGYYWSSTPYDGILSTDVYYAYDMYFSDSSLGTDRHDYRIYGQAVRLVQDYTN